MARMSWMKGTGMLLTILSLLMVTAAGKPEEVQSCLDAGCDDYITKPVNKQELQEKVQRLLVCRDVMKIKADDKDAFSSLFK